MEKVVDYVHQLADHLATVDVSDQQLLSYYADQGEESAFSALLGRHGPMVLGVCRRLLRDSHFAEDAFQATFLVLACKAKSIKKRKRLGSWLYSVAYRVASRLRKKEGHRLCLSVPAEDHSQPAASDEASCNELRFVLDEEIQCLPRHYRETLFSCCFEGKTYAEAARALECSEGTIKSRLARAREQLQQRLKKRGWESTATALTPSAVNVAVSPTLFERTVSQAMGFGSGRLGAASSSTIEHLALGVSDLTVKRSKIVAALIVAALLGVIAVTWMIHTAVNPSNLFDRSKTPNQSSASRPKEPSKPKPPAVKQREKGSFQVTLHRVFKGVSGPVAFNPEGSLLAGWKGGLVVHDSRTGERTATIGSSSVGLGRHLAFSKDGRSLFAFSPHSCMIIDLEVGRVLDHIYPDRIRGSHTPGAKERFPVYVSRYHRELKNHSRSMVIRPARAYSSDGSLVAFLSLKYGPPPARRHGISTDRRKNVPAPAKKVYREPTVWRLAENNQLTRIKFEQANLQLKGGDFLAFSADNQTLAVASSFDNSVTLWNVATGDLNAELKEVYHPIALSSDGRMVAAGPNVISVETGQRHTLQGAWRSRPNEFVSNGPLLLEWSLIPVAFSPDGSLLAGLDRDEKIKLWNVSTGEVRAVFEGSTLPAVFSADGETLATGGNEGITLWNLYAPAQ